MANLLFCPGELLNEISALRGLAARFVDRASPYRLEELTDEIEGLRARGGTHTLKIPQHRPLLTRVSVGEFEQRNRRSARRVYGSITGVWELEAGQRPVGDPARPNRKAKPRMLIGFTGKASTVFEVKDDATAKTLACWKMEFGDAISPGCFFHTFASADHNFPVPRHPNIFATPMAAIGFALGELFQTAWEETVSGTSDAPNRWRSIQTKRFEALFNWQLQQVKNSVLSPWCTLKLAKPHEAMFL